MFSRRVPYDGESLHTVLVAVRDGGARAGSAGGAHPKRPGVPDGCPALVEAMMAECWAHDPAVRPTFDALGVRVNIVDLSDFTRPAPPAPRPRSA